MKYHGKPTCFEEIVSGPKEADLLVKSIREQHGLVCERCGSNRFSWLSRISHWQCNHCRKRISLKKGTFMEHSNMPIYDWLKLLFLFVNHKQSLAATTTKKTCGFNRYETTWYMMHRIRKFMADHNYHIFKEGKFQVDIVREMNMRIRKYDNKLRFQERKVLMFPQGRDFTNVHGDSVMFLIATKGLPCDNTGRLNEKMMTRYRYLRVESNLHLRYHGDIVFESGSGPVHPWEQHVLRNLDRKLFGIHFTVSSFHLQLYLDEFTFKYFRRNKKEYFMETLKIGLAHLV